MTSLPLLEEARALLYVSVVLPIVFGVIARLAFFRLDADDARLHRESRPGRLAAEQRDPNPEPAYQAPWPTFEPAPDSSVVADEALPAFVYRGFGADRDAVRAAVESVWSRLAVDKESRSRWPVDWSGSAPYALGGTQGGAGSSATLTVKLRQTRDEAVLRELWQQEFLPELRELFGANNFRSG